MKKYISSSLEMFMIQDETKGCQTCIYDTGYVEVKILEETGVHPEPGFQRSY